MTFDDHHNDPPRVWCARGMRKPKPGCCWARRLLFDRHSRRPLLVAEKKGLHRLQWMRTLRFMSFFSKRFRALGCPNWAALLMGYFESPYWEIKLGWCHGPAQQVLRTSLEWNLPKTSQAIVCLGSTHILHRAVHCVWGLWQEVAEMIRIHLFSIWGTRTDDSQLGLLCDLLQFAAPKIAKKMEGHSKIGAKILPMVFRWFIWWIHWSPKIKSSAIFWGTPGWSRWPPWCRLQLNIAQQRSSAEEQTLERRQTKIPNSP